MPGQISIAPMTVKRWWLPWILSFGGRLPAEGAETYAMSIGGIIQCFAGCFGSSARNETVANACMGLNIGGIALWNICGGDPNKLIGLDGQRFNPMNELQREEIKHARETGTKRDFWKRLDCKGMFRRSAMQAIIGAVSGGGAWISWAVGSGYAGPGEEYVRPASFVLMLALTAICGWSMSDKARVLLMGLNKNRTLSTSHPAYA